MSRKKRIVEDDVFEEELKVEVGNVSDLIHEEVKPEFIPELKVEEKVIVTVPKAFKLRLDSNEVLEFRPGVQKVAKDIANHWYAKANGMKVFEG